MTAMRILIVEDEPVIGLALEDMIETLGWVSIGVVGRVSEALKLIDTERPDAAILDVNLHGEQSYKVADILADRGLLYIFATGYGDSEHPERHRAIRTLTKPYSLADVQAALADAQN